MRVKKYKIQFLLLISFLALFANSCSNSENDENNEGNQTELSNNLLIKIFNSNGLNISQTFKNTIFSFESNKSDSDINSRFKITTLDKKVVYEIWY